MSDYHFFSKVHNFFRYASYYLCIPSYIFAYLLFVDSDFVLGKSLYPKVQLWVSECLNLTFFPLLTLFFLKLLGFQSTLFPREKKDRILPYFSGMIFYFWAYYVHKNQSSIPIFHTDLIFIWAVALLIGLLLNHYHKTSISVIMIFSVVLLSAWEVLTGKGTVSVSLWVYSIVGCGIIVSLKLYAVVYREKEIYLSFIVGGMAVFINIFRVCIT